MNVRPDQADEPHNEGGREPQAAPSLEDKECAGQTLVRLRQTECLVVSLQISELERSVRTYVPDTA